MKKIIIFTISIFLFFANFNSIFASSSNCRTDTTNGAAGIKNFLSNCASGTKGIDVGANSSSIGGEHEQFKAKVISVVENALRWAALFAILAMVVSGIMYTTAYGKDQQLTKAKNTAIFAALGLLITLIAFPFVNVIISFVYNIGSVR